jgi:autotransporter adhesin
VASGTNAIAIGAGSQATNTNAIAQGFGAQATGVNSIAVGTGALATGSIAVGNTAQASNGGAAFGDFSNTTCATCTANVSSATALGNSASATVANAVAVGQSATVLSANGTAIGAGAVVRASATNAVAIGQGSVATAPNTVSFGSPGNERRLSNVAAGIAPTDAVNVAQLNSFAGGITGGLQGQINGLQGEINTNQTEARAGIALALASTALQYDPRPGKLSIAAAVGNFKGQSALASGLGYAISDRWRVNASFSATPQVNQYGAAIGSSWTLN